MKIKKATDNQSEERLELCSSSGRTYYFPYDEMMPRPSSGNPIKRLYVDRELAGEAVTYVLRSGEEGAVHIEHAVSYSRRAA